jgi:hypothetical protein
MVSAWVSSFQYLDEPTALYRLSPNQMSGNALRMAETQLQVYRKLAKDRPNSEYIRGIRQQIKIFGLEVLHQRRRKAVSESKRLGAAWLTLKMMRVAPERTPRFVAASALALIRPAKYR